ncbi:MAG: family 10 glycosylhydrolase [Pirellulales bacterium]|nr:family 10 glycosylhydrolase [Pirellulales bacterium]
MRQPWNQRRWHAQNALGWGTLLALLLFTASEILAATDRAHGPQQPSAEQIRQQRRQAAQRTRRIIFNNDGNDARTPPDEPHTHANFLSKRTTALAGSQVDAIFYCTGVFNLYTHHSTESEPRAYRENNVVEWAWELGNKGPDSLETMVQFGHEHGMEVFWSMRMNDCHDSTMPRNLCQWKRNHPECLMGKKGDRFKAGGNRWSALNYAVPGTREKVYRILKDVATRYDVDGLELDFLRSPVYFLPQMHGQPVTQEHCDLMTDLLRRVRQMADCEAVRRGRPMLIAVRVPDSLGYARAIGLDLARWLEDDLVDLMTVADMFRLNPWETSVELGHKAGVPVYASLSESRLRDEEAKALRRSPACYRGRALEAWAAGVDGIYLFNFFDPHSELWRELGDPEKLRSLEHAYTTGFTSSYNADAWLAGARRRFLNLPIPLPERPRKLTSGNSVAIEVRAGEPPDADPAGAKTGQVTAHLRFNHAPRDPAAVNVKLNGHLLATGTPSKGWLTYRVPLAWVQKGVNRFEVQLAPNRKETLLLQDLMLVDAGTQGVLDATRKPSMSTVSSSGPKATIRPSRVPIYLNWDYNCLTLGPAGIAELVHDAREAGVNGVNLRISNKGALNCRTRVGTCYAERLDAFGKHFDPLATLVGECRKQGIAANVWFDLFEAAYDSLITAHPEFSPQGLPGKPRLAGVPCYAHPEVRRHMLDIVDELAAYRPDAVFFCTKSSHVPRNQLGQPHNADSGFNPPVVRRYQELYGVNVLKKSFDQTKLGRIRGEFLIDFLVEARQRLNQAGISTIVGATVNGRLQSTGPNLILDWRRILERKAADRLLMANSRGEYYVFYNTAGRKKFAEIRRACDREGIPFWPYILSSGTHQPIAARIGFAGLLEYLPRQIDYLTALGGDAVLIHDLDLYSYDRRVRRALWKAAGRRQTELARAANPEDVLPPDPVDFLRDRKNPIPGGDFEQDAEGPRSVHPAWLLGNVSFETHDSDSRPAGWTPELGGNPKFQAVYDWKVMHGDPFSGRSFYGRASVALGVQPGAAKGERTAAWTAEIPVPRGLQGDQRIRVQVHGESLNRIKSVGMRIDCFDAKNKVLDKLNAIAPREGTFAWQPLEIIWPADARAKKLRVRLGLTVANDPSTEGRVWFDDFSIEPIEPVESSPDAPAIRLSKE